ncbi:hypothetical protein [Sphingobacterium mizutaii]|uniref:hypothetical protein n=1 Tax=Sphingobacterium mizutaii TaxID=1010 RepID=UPI00162645EF|nr:hypothetical protein [Sphingobacterium mizutaii]
MDLHIIPECFVDTNLIETLVPTGSGFNHQKGCGTVAKVMKEKFADNFAVGIIDKDKQQLDYLNEFDEVHSYGTLTLHKHKTRHHYIVQIFPAIERFILVAAEDCQISLDNYDLPLDFNELKKTSKSVNSKYDKKFKQLFKDLLSAGNQEFITLSNWITYLKDNNYNVEIEVLKEI